MPAGSCAGDANYTCLTMAGQIDIDDAFMSHYFTPLRARFIEADEASLMIYTIASLFERADTGHFSARAQHYI